MRRRFRARAAASASSRRYCKRSADPSLPAPGGGGDVGTLTPSTRPVFGQTRHLIHPITESGSDAAPEVLGGPHLRYLPELIRLEVLGARARRVRTGEVTREETEWCCQISLGRLPTPGIPRRRSFICSHSTVPCVIIGATDLLFTNPKDARGEACITGRIG
jgi:hypothetical protein